MDSNVIKERRLDIFLIERIAYLILNKGNHLINNLNGNPMTNFSKVVWDITKIFCIRDFGIIDYNSHRLALIELEKDFDSNSFDTFIGIVERYIDYYKYFAEDAIDFNEVVIRSISFELMKQHYDFILSRYDDKRDSIDYLLGLKTKLNNFASSYREMVDEEELGNLMLELGVSHYEYCRVIYQIICESIIMHISHSDLELSFPIYKMPQQTKFNIYHVIDQPHSTVFIGDTIDINLNSLFKDFNDKAEDNIINKLEQAIDIVDFIGEPTDELYEEYLFICDFIRNMKQLIEGPQEIARIKKYIH
jgi:hypothetical protein